LPVLFMREYLKMAEAEEKVGGKVGEKGGQKELIETREKTREKIIHVIRENSYILMREFADRIGITEKRVEWQIKRLKKEVILKHIGPAKGGHWEVLR